MSETDSWFGLDIGGANIKAYDALHHRASSLPFPMWKHPDQLQSRLAILIKDLPKSERIAATMTGELADCFATRSEGVVFIARALVAAADGRSVVFYSTDGEFASLEIVLSSPQKFAASNWLASAVFAARFLTNGQGMFIDIGSTTTDIIPISLTPSSSSTVDTTSVGATDPQRLQRQTLVYAGVERTPVCGLVNQISFEGRAIPLARELFATTGDAFVVLGETKPTEDCDTADGRPANLECSQMRLARMFCSDLDTVHVEQLVGLAKSVDDALMNEVSNAIRQVVSNLQDPPTEFILAGQGEWKARQIIQRMFPDANLIGLAEQLNVEQSRAVCAVAVSTLAQSVSHDAR